MGGSGETVGERTARGRAARRDTPRTEHARFDPPAKRPDPLLLLEAQAVTRVADLVPIRYGRMLASPFAFFRGAALIMASDLAGTPRSGLQAQLCGDAHLSNFGVFASPERRLVFDLNDFDETLPVGVGRQAPGGKLRRPRSRKRPGGRRAALDRPGDGVELPAGDAPLRRDAGDGRLVCAG